MRSVRSFCVANLSYEARAALPTQKIPNISRAAMNGLRDIENDFLPGGVMCINILYSKNNEFKVYVTKNVPPWQRQVGQARPRRLRCLHRTRDGRQLCRTY